jgi:hypothetical protein
MNQDREHVRLLAIFHYVVAGLAALLSFFPLLYSGDRRFLALRCSPSRSEERRTAASGPWLDFHCLGRTLLHRGYCNGDLHSDCWPMPLLSQRLLVRARDGVHRMPLCSVRNNPRSLYDRCAFARVSKSAVSKCVTADLKSDARTRAHSQSFANLRRAQSRRPQSSRPRRAQGPVPAPRPFNPPHVACVCC